MRIQELVKNPNQNATADVRASLYILLLNILNDLRNSISNNNEK